MNRPTLTGILVSIGIWLLLIGLGMLALQYAITHPGDKSVAEDSSIAIPESGLKTVASKMERIENRFSGTDFMFGEGSITKSKTVYYLVATDGTACEVGMSEYARTKVGEKYSGTWREVH